MSSENKLMQTIHRVMALPEQDSRELGAVYMVRDPLTNDLVFHVVGKTDKSQVTSTLSRTQIQGLISAATGSSMSELPSDVVRKGSDGKIALSDLPDIILDEVFEVDAFNKLPGNEEATGGKVASKGVLYVVATEGSTEIYRWSGTQYIKVSNSASSSEQALKLAEARTIKASEASDATFEVSFDGSKNVEGALSLKTQEGVTAGEYFGLTVNEKGLITATTKVKGVLVEEPEW